MFKSPAEEAFAKFLRKNNILFEHNINPDYLLPEVDFLIGNTVIEIDGRDFHNKKQDMKKDSILKKAGYKVIRIPASDAFDENKVKIHIKNIFKDH